ncbi:MAG: EamA family transporter RarD [Pseudobacteriovorax sp.]|nr:EamA family transporter RarD [Pseudobacteriovorax sp.]
MINKARAGLATAALAYILWGLSPLYFILLKTVPAWEVLSHRILWSVVALLPFCLFLSGKAELKRIFTDKAILKTSLISSILISLNWVTFIYAVSAGRTLEASLGYFLNPIFIVFLGRVAFRERLTWNQNVCLGLAALGLSVQVIATGSLSWISLLLVVSFGFYSLIKKKLSFKSWDSLLLETCLSLPVAAFYLWYRHDQDLLVWLSTGQNYLDWVLPLSGLVTAVPLVLFAFGAQRLPMATLGFLQYIAPSLQFLVAIVVLGEELNMARLLSFVIIWIGLVVLVTGPRLLKTTVTSVNS